MDIQGQGAIVTGAGSGIGAAIDADKVEMVQQSLTRLTDQASNELLKTFGFQ